MCFVVLTKHHRIDTVVMYDMKFHKLMKKKNYKHHGQMHPEFKYVFNLDLQHTIYMTSSAKNNA